MMHAAIPDSRCEIEQMIVAGDRVVVHLHFRGHFTGRFKQTQGQGQAIDFVATDIYRIANGRIADNWHIEDNLTLMQQDRKSTRLNSSHVSISYAVFCLKKKKNK